MSDFEGAQPIRTVRDNETMIILVDGASGTTATKKLTITEAGVTYVGGTNDFGIPAMGKDADGKSIILPVPMPITDNGDSLTVDAIDLDIRNLVFADDKVDVSGSEVTVTGTVSISGTVTVEATDLDIRNLSHSQDSVKIGDGTDFLGINPDGSINTNPSLFPSGSTKVYDYQTSATVGVNNEVIHFYTVTNAKTFLGKVLTVGARGQVKVRFGYSSNGTSITTVKGIYFQEPRANHDHNIEMAELLGDATAAIAIGITNLDGNSSDVYSTLQGLEI